MSSKQLNEAKDITVGQALLQLARHPIHSFVINWNWKSALFSALLRASIFLIATIRRPLVDISVAVAVEIAFSTAVAGVYGSFTQAMRWARPEWLSRTIFVVVLPSILLLFDYIAHFYTGMRHMRLSLIMSAIFTGLASLFNLYIMRQGVMLVGGEGGPLHRDLRSMPRLIAGFVAHIPLLIWRCAVNRLRGSGVQVVG